MCLCFQFTGDLLLELAAFVVAALAGPVRNSEVSSAEGRKNMLLRQVLSRSAEDTWHRLVILLVLLLSSRHSIDDQELASALVTGLSGHENSVEQGCRADAGVLFAVGADAGEQGEHAVSVRGLR